MTHILKVWPEFYEAIENGSKTFEIRSTKDRKFKVGELVVLKWFDPKTNICNGEEIKKRISYVLDNPDFGIKEGYAILGLQEGSNDGGNDNNSESNRINSST